LADGDQNSECDSESGAQNPVESGCETEAANGGKQSFPGQSIVIQPASCSIVLDPQRDAGRNAGSESKEETQADAVTDAEDERVGYRAGKQSQWTMLSTQQVVGKIETAQDIKTRACNADGRNCVMVHSTIEGNTLAKVL
jgi:hypothetical protein